MEEQPMITLELVNFRCWRNLKLELPTQQAILLKGDTGEGKTTILQSIKWILFGKLKKVAPKTLKSAKTQGTMIIDYMKIERTRNPITLKVTIEDKIYQDDVAQSVIEEKFGNYDVWNVSCYIEQKSLNPFITDDLKNEVKLKILNKISFGNTDPSKIIKSMDEKILLYKRDYDQSVKLYKQHEEQFQKDWGHLDLNTILTEEQVNILKEEMENHKIQKRRLEEYQTMRRLKLEEKENIEKEIEKCDSFISKSPHDNLLHLFKDDSIGNVHSCSEMIHCIQLTIKNMEEKELYTKKINQIIETVELKYPLNQSDLILEDLKNRVTILQEEYLECLKIENKFETNQMMCKKLDVSYQEQEINQKIEQYLDIIESQPYLQTLLKKSEYEKEMDMIDLNMPVDPFEKDWVLPTSFEEIEKPILDENKTRLLNEQIDLKISNKGKLQQQIQQQKVLIENAKNVLTCPECQHKIKYHSGKLFSFESAEPEELLSTLLLFENDLKQVEKEIFDLKKEVSSLKLEEHQIIQDWEKNNKQKRKEYDDILSKYNRYHLSLERYKIEEMKKDKLVVKLASIENNLSELKKQYKNKKIYQSKELDTFNLAISKLKEIEMIKIVKKSSQVKEMIRSIERTIEKQNLISKRDDIFISEMFSIYSCLELKTLQGNLEQWINDLKTSQTLDHRKIEWKQKLLSLEIPEDQKEILDHFVHQIAEIKQNLSENNTKEEANTKNKELIQSQINMEVQLNKVSQLRAIREYAAQSQCEILEYNLDCINSSILHICSMMFDEKIDLSLSLTKENSQKKIKQDVHLLIDHKGESFEDIIEMSGGEKDRISVALTSAFNSLSKCPFIMLDESMNGVGWERRESAIRTIRELSPFKTILCVSYDEYEDIYDHIIDISKIPKIKAKEIIKRAYRPQDKVYKPYDKVYKPQDKKPQDKKPRAKRISKANKAEILNKEETL